MYQPSAGWRRLVAALVPTMSLVLVAGCSTESNTAGRGRREPERDDQDRQLPARDAAELLLRHEAAQGAGRGAEPQPHAGPVPEQPARARRRALRRRPGRRHRHRPAGRLGDVDRLPEDRCPRRRLRLQRHRPLLQVDRPERAGLLQGLQRSDRHDHHRRLVLRDADLHRDRADPQAGGPRQPEDPLPEHAAVPRQRQGARRQRRRDRGRGAVPRPPAGRRPGPGEPGRRHPRAEVRRDPQGRQPDQPPGRHALRRHLRQDAGQDEPGPEGRAVQGRPATSGPRTASASTTRPRRCSTDGAPTPARTVVEIDQVDRQAFITKAEAYFKTYYKGANLTLYQSIRASA